MSKNLTKLIDCEKKDLVRYGTERLAIDPSQFKVRDTKDDIIATLRTVQPNLEAIEIETDTLLSVQEEAIARSNAVSSGERKLAMKGVPQLGGKPIMDEMRWITIADGPNTVKGRCYINLNGRSYPIKTGVRVAVPIAVVRLLDNAVEKIYETDSETDERISISRHSYSFTVHGPVYEDELPQSQAAA